MTDAVDRKAYLKRHLASVRDTLLWKLERVSEYDARRPMTPTGTNLAGMVKHAANVEITYFGPTFGRVWPTDEAVSEEQFEVDPQVDWYLTENESVAWLLDFYPRVWAFADATIDDLPLDAIGEVPHWPVERRQVSLEQVIIHVHTDLSRHAGQADVLRELIDGQVGLTRGNSNIYGTDFDAYGLRLEALAEAADPQR